MPSETPITASFTLLGLGRKLRRRWKNGICCVGRGDGFGEDELVVSDSFVVRVWDSSSTVLEGSMVVVEVVVLLLQIVDEAATQHSS